MKKITNSFLPKLVCRKFKAGDVVQIADIHDASRRLELSASRLEEAFLPFTVAAERENFYNYTVLVAERASTIKGFIAYSNDEIAWLYVDPTKHSTGVGANLVAEALKSMASLVTVEVLVGNTSARGFYERLGFVLSDTDHGVMPGNEEFEVSVWTLTLNQNLVSAKAQGNMAAPS